MHPSITTYLENLEHSDPERYVILSELRDIVLTTFPGISEQIKYG